MFQVVIVISSLFGFLGVALGAFGAHALRERLSPERLSVFQTGVFYQMMHALALLGLGIVMHIAQSSNLWVAAAWCFIVGVVLFSGSLYTLCLTGIRKFGAITPIGGVAFLVGWVLFGIGALTKLS